MKRLIILYCLLIILIVFSGCATSRLKMENISNNYGLLSYDNGAFIPIVSDETRSEMMEQYCAPRNYEIIETDTKTVGQYHFRTKILFKCIKKEN